MLKQVLNETHNFVLYDSDLSTTAEPNTNIPNTKLCYWAGSGASSSDSHPHSQNISSWNLLMLFIHLLLRLEDGHFHQIQHASNFFRGTKHIINYHSRKCNQNIVAKRGGEGLLQRSAIRWENNRR